MLRPWLIAAVFCGTALAAPPPALDEAKEKGFEYVVCPYIAPQDRGGADVMKKLGETLNAAGERCQKAGLHLCYHNHAFEFQPEGSGTLLDVLMQTADPKLVNPSADPLAANFRLQPGSPAIGAADGAPAPPTDLDGGARPGGHANALGAYQGR